METKTDLVREVSSEKHNKKIDKKAIENIKEYKHKTSGQISERIQELDKEWDMERLLELNAASLVVAGVLLGLKDKRFLVLSGVVGAFLIQHALQGWCPPVEIFRALGIRTRKEIDRERYALKALHGDFDEVHSPRDAWRKAN